MAINYVDKYGKELDQKLVFGTYTNELETSNLLWLDAKTFKIQTITTTGLKPHTRNKGYNEGSASNENTAYTITFDRDVEFFVDVMDVDETGQALTAANVTKEFNSRHSAPEVDAYRFSKLATEAKKNGYSTAETITEENVFRTLKAAIRKVKKYGTQNLVMYVSVDVMAALELSKDFTRTISNQNIGPSSLETRVTGIDGVKLVEIEAEDRFYDTFDFTDGYKPAASAKKLNYLLINKGSVIGGTKHASIYLHAPGSVGQGDGWLYQYRVYHDIFVKEQQKDGVIASTVA
ncbi:hypothetical protein ACEXFN_001625 [Listeria monocytogenes]|uniref:Phage major capsid protein n=5 Tax=Listeria monocytogenes TaxID=1639 RepID=A0A394SL40_LISMN|nr:MULTISPECIES: hypothetical protein [Listeria]EAF3060628.1 hypothetical protein [Listeria monocytogenes serotype 1/2a]EAG6289614.1 hypothetical protein [Listeria monocytogenes CFSAN003825]EAG6316868.1 hypothetical protein [Listeria monocytogenes CFSAN003824]EEP3938642.1 hypothetical protein [Listeria monocytogenes serotype 1/2b]AEO04706.1 main capsid protein Gp34 [Listeria monocytogenes J0161]